ncbi:DegV family protein [Thermanaerothrix sp. 4228-RoL]|uniref:DegV family protein n=1 Tax=Thermanaerothrix solaris TaxID=3058434 RepID=A0ABU3NKR8_9CHLR|nr:DegV family protein [Thermanaerothrix sp. 4228-RoL]MDT8897436.1 DegV family protein [Thermanaerothrix sp. 4228-RoL]
MTLQIVTDGSADIPEDWQRDYQIHVIPLSVRFGEESYSQHDLTFKDFYALVRQKHLLPKTSLPSPQQVVEFYRRIANKGDSVLSIHLSSKLSGTFAAVQMAARELAGELNIYPFDSGAGSAALGFMCREARILSWRGWDIERILQRLTQIRDQLMILFTLENLEFAQMSGRINALQGAISSLLKINPIIKLREGLLYAADKVRGRQRALERIVEDLKQQMQERKINLAVVHAAAPEVAQELVTKIKALLNCQDVIVTDLSVPVAAHLGPGTIGIVAYPVTDEEG